MLIHKQTYLSDRFVEVTEDVAAAMKATEEAERKAKEAAKAMEAAKAKEEEAAKAKKEAKKRKKEL